MTLDCEAVHQSDAGFGEVIPMFALPHRIQIGDIRAKRCTHSLLERRTLVTVIYAVGKPSVMPCDHESQRLGKQAPLRTHGFFKVLDNQLGAGSGMVSTLVATVQSFLKGI